MENQLLKFRYNNILEEAVKEIEACLKGEYGVSKREIALLLLQEDQQIEATVREVEGHSYERVNDIVRRTKSEFPQPVNYIIALERQQWADKITDMVVKQEAKKGNKLADTLNRFTIQPLTGIPILLLVLYFGLYKFVGSFGAGTVVDFLEGVLFEEYINPWVNGIVTTYIPWEPLQELIALDYGIITLGLRYAVAIILPIVGAFFLVFSIIEDTGYLPRLALLADRLFKKIGLSGRAVIPMTLGFGCGTMATMVSRTLETKREKMIATFLLALTIPCSAQLGLILALLSDNIGALLVWLCFVLVIFLFIGFLTAKIMPGEKSSFYMEVPPLRLPKLSNVLSKTFSRMQWYFMEILPLFILGSIIIWIGNITGVFVAAVKLLESPMQWLGLPVETAESFLYGFFRRDYGAAG
jgi:ferrous iron transport protein B